MDALCVKSSLRWILDTVLPPLHPVGVSRMRGSTGSVTMVRVLFVVMGFVVV
jgi:uncharacterized membrane protein YqaE (UPF0057 family)